MSGKTIISPRHRRAGHVFDITEIDGNSVPEAVDLTDAELGADENDRLEVRVRDVGGEALGPVARKLGYDFQVVELSLQRRQLFLTCKKIQI